jgi:hypothetical protein
VAPFAQHFQHADVVVVPLRDLPPSTCVLAGLKDDDAPARDAFSSIVEEVLKTP